MTAASRQLCIILAIISCVVRCTLSATAIPSEAVGPDAPVTDDSGKRPVTVADAIQMTRPTDLEGGAIAHYSSDGKKFVAVVRKGNLARNTNDFSMLLWRADEVLNSRAPEVLLTLSSSSNRDAIEDVTWLRDNETVAFLGERTGELHQLFSFNTRTHTLRELTKHPTNLISYSINSKGDGIAYVAEGPVKSIFDKNAQRNGVIATTQALTDLLAGKRVEARSGRDQQLFFKFGRTLSRLMHVAGQIPLPREGIPKLSPDGNYILIALQVDAIPDTWREYSDARIHELTTRKLALGQYSWLTRYVLIETVTGKNRILIDCPLQWNTDASWSADSRSLILSNTYLPIEGTDPTERQTRRDRTFTVEVKIPSCDIVKISDEDLHLLSWEGNSTLVFEPGKLRWQSGPRRKIIFKRTGNKWDRLGLLTQKDAQPEITVEEDMITPPRILGFDPGTKRRALLLDLNPAFKELKFARVEEVKWKSTDGHEVKGGLCYPLDYVPGKKYPLVIQTHEWYADKFLIDGPYSTAFAAQPLAGNGIMVLQAEYFEDKDPDWFHKEVDTPKEIERYVSAYEGAIDYLDEKGLIDRHRVGIIGFSRTCLYVKYALTHSTYRFAAASVTDGIDGGYFQYIAFNANVNLPREFEGFNGGPPFGQGLGSWKERSPGFNVDKIRTPLRIMAENTSVILFEWEWFATLRRLGKPVEMVITQDGSHELQKPWERMISLQGNVDWFRFWLKGEEDPDPAKADQYVRWRELRKLQEANGKKTSSPTK